MFAIKSRKRNKTTKKSKPISQTAFIDSSQPSNISSYDNAPSNAPFESASHLTTCQTIPFHDTQTSNYYSINTTSQVIQNDTNKINPNAPDLLNETSCDINTNPREIQNFILPSLNSVQNENDKKPKLITFEEINTHNYETEQNANKPTIYFNESSLTSPNENLRADSADAHTAQPEVMRTDFYEVHTKCTLKPSRPFVSETHIFPRKQPRTVISKAHIELSNPQDNKVNQHLSLDRSVIPDASYTQIPINHDNDDNPSQLTTCQNNNVTIDNVTEINDMPIIDNVNTDITLFDICPAVNYVDEATADHSTAGEYERPKILTIPDNIAHVKVHAATVTGIQHDLSCVNIPQAEDNGNKPNISQTHSIIASSKLSLNKANETIKDNDNTFFSSILQSTKTFFGRIKNIFKRKSTKITEETDTDSPTNGCYDNCPSNSEINAINFTKDTLNVTIKGKIADKTYNFLIDSGATHTIVHSKVFNEFKDILKCQTHTASLKSVNGNELYIQGQTVVPFEIDGQIYQFNAFIVDNITYDIILGTDFLEHFNAVVDFNNKSLSFSNDIPSEPVYLHNDSTIHADQTYILPPQSEFIILAYLKFPFDPGGFPALSIDTGATRL